MYSRKNCNASSPGVWFSDDGEFEFFREGKSWSCRYRAYFDYATPTRGAIRSRVIGSGPTLASVFALAGRYYMHPVVPADTWEYPTD